MRRQVFRVILGTIMMVTGGSLQGWAQVQPPEPPRARLHSRAVVAKPQPPPVATHFHTAYNQAVSLTLQSPVAIFQRSHRAGAGLEYAWSRKHFGIAQSRRNLGLLLKGGGDYFLGKQVTTAGYHFRYDDYLYFHALAGLIYNPLANMGVSITAGPSLGVYAGNSSVGIMGDASIMFFTKQRFALGSVLEYRKHHQANALWSLGIRGSYAF